MVANLSAYTTKKLSTYKTMRLLSSDDRGEARCTRRNTIRFVWETQSQGFAPRARAPRRLWLLHVEAAVSLSRHLAGLGNWVDIYRTIVSPCTPGDRITRLAYLLLAARHVDRRRVVLYPTVMDRTTTTKMTLTLNFKRLFFIYNFRSSRFIH